MTLFENILAANARIRPQVPITPLTRSNVLSAKFGCEVMLKCDHLQPTGSFKIRGATNGVLTLQPEQHVRGVTAASTGNFGQALARAGALSNVPITVYVSASTVPVKMDAIRAFGAELVIIDGAPYEAEREARAAADREGKFYLSPYNDPNVVAGQGTLGVELIEQAPDLDAVFISVGGGGLIGGTGTAIKHLRSQTRVVGTWPENSPCMLRAIEAGGIVDVVEYDTLSDGTAGAIELGSITYPICESVIDDMVTVDERQIAVAMRQIAEADQWMVEGAAGVALAGFAKIADRFKGGKVAIVLCGRNIAFDTFNAAVAGVAA
ncbi:MAG: hypothetical protein JWO65_1966 [Sphingomonas bacterium]|nr:hypothetical protein [Sphingomonas bacterium]